MKIMVVDDSKIIRGKITNVVRNIRDSNFTITGIARNGIEAIELCRKTMPDLVTMDLTMPELDGVASISELVNIKPDILILVVSALADKATAIEALKRGAHGFICKPFTDEQLEDAINEMIYEG